MTSGQAVSVLSFNTGGEIAGMHAWEAIQNSLNYIEDHLSEDIKIETLANEALLSPYYFQRLFRRLVKKPVGEYVKLRRLAKASEALENKEIRIIDVALAYGFSDHANFTRAFRDAYGITPDEFRAGPVILNQFIKPDLLLDYVVLEEDVPLITDGIVIEVTRKKLDKARTFIGIKEEIPGTELAEGKATGIAAAGMIWDEFHHLKHNIPNLLPTGNEFGVLYRGNARESCCTYMAGAEAAGNVQEEGYVSYTLSSGEYAVCCFEAENFSELVGSAIFKAYSFMGSWMKKHKLVFGNYIAEMYYGTTADACCMELWLPQISSQRVHKMKKTWDKTNGAQKPSMAEISDYVNSPLFDCLCNYMETEYQSKPVLEYSKCSKQYGWNVKYKKAGRTLCTLYPMEGYYIALIVIGDHEKTETELILPAFTEYLQQLYHQTKTGMGQKWLMVNVTDDEVLEDVKKCIAIRRGKKKN